MSIDLNLAADIQPYWLPPDLVICTSDNVRLFVQKSFLTSASPFFSNLLEDGQPEEMCMHLPVCRVPESSGTMRTLLHLCYGYPNRTPFDELELEEVMDALQKYCMENGKKALTEQLKNAGLTKRGPVKLKLLAMARRHDWHDLILVLARQLLFLSTQELTTLDVTSDPTLTIKDYQQFLDYHLRCSQLAERMLSLDSGKLVLSSIADNCLSCKQKYGYRLSLINEPTLWCHRWVRDFVSTLLERVKVAPLGGVALDDTFVNAITRMALLECETQTPFGARQTMETIVDVVRCAVNDVPFVRPLSFLPVISVAYNHLRFVSQRNMFLQPLPLVCHLTPTPYPMYV